MNPDFLGALGQCLSRSEANRSKLFKLYEEILLSLSEKNSFLLVGLLRCELVCAKDASTVLRGNSYVSRCTVAVLKRPVGLCKLVEQWLQSSGNVGAGEEAGLELVALLKQELGAGSLQPELKLVVKTISDSCKNSVVLNNATLPLLGGIVFLRLVCPMLMTKAVNTAKVLQSASNNPKVATKISSAVKDFLEALALAASSSSDDMVHEKPTLDLSEVHSLKLLQMMAINREEVELWLADKQLLDARKIEEMGKLLDQCDPFHSSKTVGLLFCFV